MIVKDKHGKPFELIASYDDKENIIATYAIRGYFYCLMFALFAVGAIYNLWYFCVGFCNSWQYISNTDNENPEGSQDTGMVRK